MICDYNNTTEISNFTIDRALEKYEKIKERNPNLSDEIK